MFLEIYIFLLIRFWILFYIRFIVFVIYLFFFKNIYIVFIVVFCKSFSDFLSLVWVWFVKEYFYLENVLKER